MGRVCLITKDYPPSVPGGVPRAVQMQAQLLAASGIEVHVITKSPTGSANVRRDGGALVHEVPEPTLPVPAALYYLEIAVWSLVAAAKFAELDAAIGFDVVETPDYRGEALHLTPRADTALVIWLHSTMMAHWNSTPGYVRSPSDDAWHALEMAALQRAELLLAPSQLMLEMTTGFLGAQMRPAQLMTYLFDYEQFPLVPRRPRQGPIRALFYGRIEARKNPELALRAVAAARARGLDVELTLLGHDHWRYGETVLGPLQAQLGLRDVRYQAHADITAVRAALADTDVAILPSRFDVGPMTVLESLSSGVPVITSDWVGAASWFEREDGLVSLPIEDGTRFAKAAADAIADPDWMASGPRAAAAVRERFSPDAVTDELLGCYAQLMAKRGGEAGGAPRRQSGHTPGPAIPGTRGSAVLAFADEVTTDPSLLHAWANEFDTHDDVTLVIYASDWDEQQVHGLLAPAVAAAGLEPDDAADLLALALPDSSQTRQRLARGCAAILTTRAQRTPFHTHPTTDGGALGELRHALGLRRSPRADSVGAPQPATA